MLRNKGAATSFLFITVMLDMMTFGMIGPVLPKLIAGFVGGNMAHAAFAIGVFATVWALMQFFASPLLGMLSDRVGRRPIILLSNAVSAVDYVIMALAPNLGWLFAGRVLSGIATANMTAASAYVADVTPPEQRAKAFGVLGSAFGAGFVIGPAVGGFIGNVNPRATFWAAALCCLVNTLYGIFVLPESLPPDRRTQQLQWNTANPLGALRFLRARHELWGMSWMNFFTFLAHEVFNVWVIYCIAVFGWSTGNIGLTLAMVGVLTIANQSLLVGPAVARLGERRVLLASLAVAALGMAMLGVNNGVVFVIAIVVVCLPMYNASSQAIMTRRVGPSEQGELQGALGSIRGAAWLLGPGIFAFAFAQFVGPWHAAGVPGAPWYIAAGLYAVATLIAWRTTGKADDEPMPLPEPGPIAYVEL